MRSNRESETEWLIPYLSPLKFSRPLEKNLQTVLLNYVQDNVKENALREHLSASNLCEGFVLQEVMLPDKIYDRFRCFLNVLDINTPSTRPT